VDIGSTNARPRPLRLVMADSLAFVGPQSPEPIDDPRLYLPGGPQPQAGNPRGPWPPGWDALGLGRAHYIVVGTLSELLGAATYQVPADGDDAGVRWSVRTSYQARGFDDRCSLGATSARDGC